MLPLLKIRKIRHKCPLSRLGHWSTERSWAIKVIQLVSHRTEAPMKAVYLQRHVFNPDNIPPERRTGRRNSGIQKRECSTCLEVREVFIKRQDVCWAMRAREALEKEEGGRASQTRLTSRHDWAWEAICPVFGHISLKDELDQDPLTFYLINIACRI